MGLLRSVINNLTGVDHQALFSDNDVCDDMLAYFNRQKDRSLLQDAIIDMYGTGISQEIDPGKKTAVYETYVKKGFETMVDGDMVECISIGFGAKVTNALSCLFTEDGNRFELISDTVEDPEKAEALLNWNREIGGFRTELVRADKQSIQLGSAVVYLNFENGAVKYRHVAPHNVRAIYGTQIDEDGATRAVDRTDIEDATCVIIRLSQQDYNSWNYLAIFGRSEKYPNGRHVQYVAGNTIEVPKDYADGAIEHEIEGQQANPLSYWAALNPGVDVPEYPISIIYSGMTEDGTVLPISMSLYNACIEFSRAASHTLSKSQEAAAGTKIIKDDGSGMGNGKPLPRCLTGNISLMQGQSVDIVNHDSTACTVSYQILKNLMVDVAASFSVPDYMVVSEELTTNSSSGVALQIKTRPLIKFRDFRIEENTKTVSRIFEIEKVLIALFSDAPEDEISELLSCKQGWNPGQIVLPENKTEAANRIQLLMDKGVIDIIEAIREYHQLPSDEEAIAFYEKMQERSSKYQSLTMSNIPGKQKKTGYGLPSRMNQQVNG